MRSAPSGMSAQVTPIDPYSLLTIDTTVGYVWIRCCVSTRRPLGLWATEKRNGKKSCNSTPCKHHMSAQSNSLNSQLLCKKKKKLTEITNLILGVTVASSQQTIFTHCETIRLWKQSTQARASLFSSLPPCLWHWLCPCPHILKPNCFKLISTLLISIFALHTGDSKFQRCQFQQLYKDSFMKTFTVNSRKSWWASLISCHFLFKGWSSGMGWCFEQVLATAQEEENKNTKHPA